MPPHATAFLPAIALRTLIVLVFLVVGLRMIGKRQIGQMNIYDLVLVMLLANAVQNAMTQGSGYILVGVVSSSALFLTGWALSKLFVLSPSIEKYVVGNSTLLVNDGRMISSHMKRESVTEDELMAMLRQHGLETVDKVQMAVLEVDGSISVIPKKSEKPTP